MKLFIYFLTTFLVFGCSIGANNAKSNLQEEKKTTEIDSYNLLLDLESLLVNDDLTLNSKVADSLYHQSLLFIEYYPKSKHKESVLVLAAKCSDGLNLNSENIRLIDQLLISFPLSENAPNYLYNKGKIYEEKLKDTLKASIVYKELITNYPDSQLGRSMKLYLKFLEKTESEQLDFLKN